LASFEDALDRRFMVSRDLAEGVAALRTRRARRKVDEMCWRVTYVQVLVAKNSENGLVRSLSAKVTDL
jgi:hypothetical protein